MSSVSLFAAAVVVLIQPHAEAQTESPPLPELPRAPAENEALQIPGAADVIEGGGVDLRISEDEPELTLSYGWSSRAQSVRTRDPRIAAVTQTSMDVELTFPVGGGGNLLAGETFDGLANGPSLSFSFTRFSARSGDPWDLSLNRRLAAAMPSMVQRCLAAVAAGEDTGGYTAESCREGGESPTRDFLARFSDLPASRYMRLAMPSVWAWGFEASAGFASFEYRTPVTLEENEDRELQYSLRLFGRLFPSDTVSVATLSARYERSYEAQDDTILCPTVVSDPEEDCVSAASGPPQSVEKLPIEIEYRRVLDPISGFGSFAIVPRVGYDILNDDWEGELAVYLRPARDVRILPGMSITYNSRKDEAIFGLFLRQPFGF